MRTSHNTIAARVYDDGAHGVPICGEHLLIALARLNDADIRDAFGEYADDARDTLERLELSRRSDATCACCDGTCDAVPCIACAAYPLEDL